MVIATTCPQCGRHIAAPDEAAGRRARCPQCSGVVAIPNAGPPAVPPSPLAAADQQAPTSPAQAEPAVSDLAREVAAALAEKPSPPAAEAPSARAVEGGTPSPTRGSGTTVARLAARTSPYQSLRLMAAVVFIVGMVVAALVFLGGLGGLIALSMGGRPLPGILSFVGALVAAGVAAVGAKVLSDLLRLLADMGDRTRQIVTYLEEDSHER